MLFYGTMRELPVFLAGRDSGIELDEAALRLATIEYPDLDIKPYLRLLDSYAARVGARLGSGVSFVEAANRYLFAEMGFIGNTADYYNPANSCLNEVLTSKKGIPITLAVIYIEIARRLKKPVFGIGLPGHFLVEYNDGLASTYIDVFHGGRLLDAPDCYELAGAKPDPALLARSGKGQILARMINNLRGIYFSRGAHRKSLQIINLLLEAYPDSAELYKHRGITHLRLEQTRAAKADFERYLELAPAAPDRESVEKQLASLARWLISMN
jgi:regulator of sirC expression with transglutaminase-like and TPR domain